MIALKHILLPLDGSVCSQKVMRYAFTLAQHFGAQIVALHVTHARWEQNSFEVGPDVVQKVHEGQLAEAQRICKEVSAMGRQVGVACDTQCVSGSAADMILQVAKEKAVDLIVMGTHGRSGLRHTLLGSVAEKTVQRAPCPVLVVREPEHEFVTE